MIHIRSDKDIAAMKHGGKILAEALFATLEQVKPGITELELDQFAEKFIRSRGGEPGFMRVPGYHHTICASTNEVVVHGIPGKRVLNEGDVIGVDMGVFYGGFHTDMAETVRVESDQIKALDKKDEVDKFLAVGKNAMEEGIKMAKAGNHVGHISQIIQKMVEKEAGYSIVRSLVGHGVGKELHEEPEIPGYVYGPIEKTPILRPGMTIAIEVIYNMGKKGVYLMEDDWTIATADNSLSGVFERSILITENESVILTQV